MTPERFGALVQSFNGRLNKRALAQLDQALDQLGSDQHKCEALEALLDLWLDVATSGDHPAAEQLMRFVLNRGAQVGVARIADRRLGAHRARASSEFVKNQRRAGPPGVKSWCLQR